ncbi:MAG: VCBS repeat-containing protein [Alphaproteobacteria bacterium]|nr:VCBS repeat-containing protein [Alphaproteobacteria bacterium]MCB9793396.1 VCBS repeat-containing protein [Alphaproteobacteria bacterium]
MRRSLPALLALLACNGPSGDGFAPTWPEDTAQDTGPFDEDGDGFVARVDCDDQDAEVFPGAYERPYDGVDNDCDPDTPDDDLDGDGALEDEDCDDRDPTRAPGLPDLPCDGRDQDCSGVADDAGSTVVRALSPLGVLPPGEALLIELSDPPDALDPSAVRVHGAQSGLIPGELSLSGTTLRFQPSRPPAPGERLRLTLHPLPSGDGQGVCRPYVAELYAGAADSAPAALGEVAQVSLGGEVLALAGFDGADSGWPVALSQVDASLQRHAAADLGTEATLSLPAGARPGAVADLDLDGFPELIAFSDDAVYTAPGEAGWVSEAWTRVELDYARILQIDAVDMDGDGDLDVVAAVIGDLGGDDRAHVLYNDGAGVLEPAFRGTELTARPRSMSVGDIDADGDMDLIVSTSAATLETLINDGVGTLTLDLSLPTAARLHGLQASDLDQDGDAELFAASDDGELWVVSSEDAVLNTLHQTALGFVATDTRLADWDGDGDLDVLALGPDGLSVLATQADLSLQLLVSLEGADLALALDQDGDGALELLAARGADLQLYDAR